MGKSQKLSSLIHFSLLILGLVLSPNSFSVDKLLDEIAVENVGGQPRIEIKFVDSLQYVNHSPPVKGDELRIKLQTPGGISVQQADFRRETLQWSATENVPLDHVILEPDFGKNLELIVTFDRSVSYKVIGSADSRSIYITLTDQPGAGTKPLSRTPAAKGATRSLAAVPAGKMYFIQILASQKPISNDLAIKNRLGADVHVYTVSSKAKGRTVYRQRIGLFSSKEEAKKTLSLLRNSYPDAWISEATADDINAVGGSAPMTVQTKSSEGTTEPDFSSPATEKVDLSTLNPQDAKRISVLMEQARLAMVEKNYSRAIQLYETILTYPENGYSKQALEFLGLARERNNNHAQAKAIYDEYLAKYPEGEDAERVRQRIAGILTAQEAPREKLRKAEPRTQISAEKSEFELFGGFSQFYQLDKLETETDSRTNQSEIISDLDLIARYRKNDYEYSGRFSGGYLLNFLPSGGTSNTGFTDPTLPPVPGTTPVLTSTENSDETRVSTMYFEVLNVRLDHMLRIGRQTRNTGGVLGRFDGGLFAYRVNEWARLNFNVGLPVDTSTQSPDTDKIFYGASVDIGTLADKWDFNVFIIEQRANGLIDRRAIGTEVRYFDPTKSMFALVDYDIFYDDLNSFLFLGTWTAPTKTLFNLTLDYRNSPILTTSNAIQGQLVDNIGQLEGRFTSNQLFDLARDRTPKNTTVIIGATHPINDIFQINADYTVTRLEGTPASGGVEATQRTGPDYFYSTTLIASNLFKAGDTILTGFRYADTTGTDTISWNINARYPFNEKLRVNPRFRIDYRDNVDGSTEFLLRPELRMVYRVKRTLNLELELGGEWSDLDLGTTTEQSIDYFMVVGYRLDF